MTVWPDFQLFLVFTAAQSNSILWVCTPIILFSLSISEHLQSRIRLRRPIPFSPLFFWIVKNRSAFNNIWWLLVHIISPCTIYLPSPYIILHRWKYWTNIYLWSNYCNKFKQRDCATAFLQQLNVNKAKLCISYYKRN